MTRTELERKHNWIATFKHKSGKQRECCLMATVGDGQYYWHYPDYDGLFGYGATATCTRNWLIRDIINRNLLQLNGLLPEELQQDVNAAVEAATESEATPC